MRQTSAARSRTSRALTPTAVGVVVVMAAIIGTLRYQSSASSAAPSFSQAPAPSFSQALPSTPSALSPAASPSAPTFSDVVRRDRSRPPVSADGVVTEDDGVVTQDDGVLPDGVTAFDDEYPGIANLAPELLGPLREAARDAGDDGIELYVNSGWRSPEYQDQLLRAAVFKYGSEKEATRWVATADTSAHVPGKAVDIGPTDARAWLSEHGAGYGLCQIYRNEPWHFELRSGAINRGCPSMYADSTRDSGIEQ